MTRRSFLKRFSVAVAGLAVGAELLSDRLTAENVGEFGFELKPYRGKGPVVRVAGDYGQHFYQIERAYQPLNPDAMVAVLYK